ncbi:phosphoglucosamine mutase [Nocardioides aromaticivorans]|uniref:Phosphoglucosamine mutase n=1 Tax=Nocardioides aromaticivorans TaxID=200618 RepID=A0A7Y9ZEB9_9ACTN|nr:phosphoglucosamine mutase [Nocardioides aromaticivorans]NYI43864.1 phosphoglucosamine mutase [Nocardioides aromaticivorans]
MTRIFGTDGVRGLANDKLTAELALGLGVAAARVLVEHGDFDRPRPLAVVGRDTRISGQFLEHAVVAGLASAGVDVLRLRVLPTPGVAYFTDALNADVGVVISASHNAMPDNGIKFLARGGVKLDDALEREIEEHLGQDWDRPTGGAVGRVTPYGPTVEEYAAHLVGTLDAPDARPLAGLTVVLDCAHGAASEVGPHALRLAGATVITIGAEPDGLNINDGCGSTHLDPLRKAVLEHGADAGFAVDGDADRCLAVDHTGEVVDGDQIMGILALALKAAGRLVDDTLVATVMSNLGLVQAMTAAGVTVRQTAVGDRYVLEDMRAGGYSLGGEQSGHVILRDHATTGDGLLTALHVLQRMVATGSSLQDLAGVMTRLPQVLVNVGGVDRTRTDDVALVAAVQEAEAELGSSGRVLLRPSGTEPLVRVMVEAPTAEQAESVANQLADVVRERLAL